MVVLLFLFVPCCCFVRSFVALVQPLYWLPWNSRVFFPMPFFSLLLLFVVVISSTITSMIKTRQGEKVRFLLLLRPRRKTQDTQTRMAILIFFFVGMTGVPVLQLNQHHDGNLVRSIRSIPFHSRSLNDFLIVDTWYWYQNRQHKDFAVWGTTLESYGVVPFSVSFIPPSIPPFAL